MTEMTEMAEMAEMGEFLESQHPRRPALQMHATLTSEDFWLGGWCAARS